MAPKSLSSVLMLVQMVNMALSCADKRVADKRKSGVEVDFDPRWVRLNWRVEFSPQTRKCTLEEFFIAATNGKVNFAETLAEAVKSNALYAHKDVGDGDVPIITRVTTREPMKSGAKSNLPMPTL